MYYHSLPNGCICGPSGVANAAAKNCTSHPNLPRLVIYPKPYQRVWGVGFGDWGLGSRVWGLGFGV